MSCPNCQSTKIKKNGHTYYGKQNHQCKCCGRQFVLQNKHTKSDSLKLLIEKALKERLSLRATCRVFGVSFTWFQAFGIQTDELWSFVQKKKKKRWIWVAYDPIHRLVVACHIGGGGINAVKFFFWRDIPFTLRQCYFETDNWEAYQSIIPKDQHKVGKCLTYFIEGFNATIRTRVNRLVRKILSFSKLDKWHNLVIRWFFWKFNLE